MHPQGVVDEASRAYHTNSLETVYADVQVHIDG